MAGPNKGADQSRDKDADTTVDDVRACLVCGERLSSYNPAPTCFAHTVGVPWNGPNNRP